MTVDILTACVYGKRGQAGVSMGRGTGAGLGASTELAMVITSGQSQKCKVDTIQQRVTEMA